MDLRYATRTRQQHECPLRPTPAEPTPEQHRDGQQRDAPAQTGFASDSAKYASAPA
ncbi:hypothetical protein [Kribbella sp. NPDC051770]|uniref:hypothetical protein n=1 Tax=Kribbella sp. NPDC051770 TaxID=3155413 RepID=UPI0034122E32